MDQDVSQYGKDIVDELSSMLSEELARSIDKDILRKIGILPPNENRRKKIEKIFGL